MPVSSVLHALTRAAPRTRVRSVVTHRRAQPSVAAHPARRRLEPAPPTPAPPIPTPASSAADAPTRATPPTPEPGHARPPPPRGTRTGTGTVERRPTNDQIPFTHAYVVDPETNKLSPTKRSLRELLDAARGRGPGEKRGVVVELVASSPEPIVRVTTRGEVEARYREMRRALRKGARAGGSGGATKEVQLSWGVARADLEHKLRKARRDLEKGCRVTVVVAPKNGQRPPGRQELAAFADEIVGALCEVGKEWKEREYTQRSMTLSFQKGDNSPA